MAGNQVLEWSDLDSEVKTAHLKSVSSSAIVLVLNKQLKILSRIHLRLLICKPNVYVTTSYPDEGRVAS